MSNVTVMGMGAMGSRMASNLIKAGHAVTIWNRDPSKAEPLVDVGAVSASTPRDAVREADVAISMVRDDEASNAVWLDDATGALAGMQQDAVAVESSTVTVAWARELATRFKAEGVEFIDAPVAGSRPQAEAAQLIYLVGGRTDVLERVRPILECLGSTIHHAGPSGSGSAVKLMINAMLGIQVAAVGELIGFARASGLDTEKAIEILTNSPVSSPAARLMAGMMLTGKFDPLFPIELAAKDLSYVVSTAEVGGAKVPVTEAVHRVFADAVQEGYGHANITAIVKRYS